LLQLFPSMGSYAVVNDLLRVGLGIAGSQGE
jgi:hypothetical protein